MRLALLCLFLCGCAHPHRTGYSTREIRVYQGRTDGLVRVETWKDVERGGGTFLLTDPAIASLTAFHTNQTELGGGSYIGTGQMTITIDPETGAIVAATGTAIGNIVGAALKTAIKP